MNILRLRAIRLLGSLIVVLLGGCGGGGGSAPPAGPSPLLAAQIAAGDSYVCALLDTGQLKCWGNNSSGQLGLGDLDARGDQTGEMADSLPAVGLGLGGTVTQVAGSGEHTCVVLGTGQVKCWGLNESGQLGLGDTEARGDQTGEMSDALPTVDLGSALTASRIGVGSNGYTCALLSSGRVKCWGSNANGQLGLGDRRTRGDEPNEMGDALPTVDLGNNPPGSATPLTAAQIAVGNIHTCALLDTNQVKCWGGNSSGQLGLGDRSSRGSDPSPMGDNLPAVDLGSGRTVKRVAVANFLNGFHSCAILDTGQVKCWGRNASGQLGLGDIEDRGDDADEMGDALPAVELGLNRTATQIALGVNHSCALLDTGQVKCWGSNNAGQLGLGDAETRGDQPGETGDDLPAVDLGSGRTATHITAGAEFTCAVLDTGRVKCWGANFSGQLGQGDLDTRGRQAGEMGDALSAVDLGTR